MSMQYSEIIASVTGASRVKISESIQSLWSGYGEIVRVACEGGTEKSLIVKHIELPQPSSHPRGWNTSLSHERKLRSYEVETAWYENYSSRCTDSCRVPKVFAMEKQENEILIVLEDLDAAGYPKRSHGATTKEIYAPLRWLAHFHAQFLGVIPDKLWEVGTYWHLETRPEELQVLDDRDLKEVAQDLDTILSNAKYQTFVHGDAKLANFCFSPDGTKAAAVDFQYVGGGCGMKDVAYFIGSCLYEEECESREEELLNFYFSELKSAVSQLHSDIDPHDLESVWRPLYRVAWTDFHRFVKGWSPGHWKIHSYSERVAREVVQKIRKGDHVF